MTIVPKCRAVSEDTLLVVAPVAPVGASRLTGKGRASVGFLKSAPPAATIAVTSETDLTRSKGKESDMRVFRVALFAFLAACSASAAWAQYGLYGSPDVLPVPQQNVAPGYQAYQQYQPYQPYQLYQQYQPGAQCQYPNPSYPIAGADGCRCGPRRTRRCRFRRRRGRSGARAANARRCPDAARPGRDEPDRRAELLWRLRRSV